jgi:pimeloyl-ACP methyl ester carboxylesterase
MINYLYNLFHHNVQVENLDEDVTCVDRLIPVVWLHGAGQTHNSWRYIREQLDYPHEILIDYSSLSRFHENLDEMVHKIGNEPVFVVGHSLGGLYALHLTQRCNVVGGVSVSTPYRGSSAADWAKYVIPSYPIFRDVGRRSLPIIEAAKMQVEVPWMQIVSTGGAVPYLKGENDGVCTVASMNCRNDMGIEYTDSTHYEVMVDDRVVEIITETYHAAQLANKLNQ